MKVINIYFLGIMLCLSFSYCEEKCKGEPSWLRNYPLVFIDKLKDKKCDIEIDSVYVTDFYSKKKYDIYKSLECEWIVNYPSDSTRNLLLLNKKAFSKILIKTPNNFDTLEIQYSEYNKDPKCGGESANTLLIFNKDTLDNEEFSIKVKY